MREIIINRPKRFECAAAKLNVSINGKKLAKLKNSQRIIMQVDDGSQELKIDGGFFQGKNFKDVMMIPAGSGSYQLQVDFITSKSSYTPILRPCTGEAWVKDDPRVMTIMGSTLAKLLMDEKLRDGLRKLPGAQLHLVLWQTDWKLMLSYNGTTKDLFASEYASGSSGLAGALVNLIDRGDLTTPEGRAKFRDKVLTDYVCPLPDYERVAEASFVFKG